MNLGTYFGNIGLQFSKIREFRRASEIQRAALAWKLGNGSPPVNIARSYYLLAEAEYARGEYRHCLYYVDMGRRAFAYPDLEPLQERALRAVTIVHALASDVNQTQTASPGWSLDSMPVPEDVAKAIGYARRMRSSEDPTAAALAELALAELLHDTYSVFAPSAECFYNAAHRANSSGALELEARAFEGRAYALWECGALADAEQNFEIALSIRLRLQASLAMLATGASLALVQMARDRKQQGYQTLSNILMQSVSFKPDTALCDVLLATGMRLREWDFIDEAVFVFQSALARFSAAPDAEAAVSRFYTEWARCLFVTSDFEGAIGVLDLAIASSQQAGHSGEMSRYLVNAAWAYHRLGLGDAAMNALQKARDLAQGLNDISLDQYISGTSIEVMAFVGLRVNSGGDRDPTRVDIGSSDHLISVWVLEEDIKNLRRSEAVGEKPELVAKMCLLGSQYDGRSIRQIHHTGSSKPLPRLADPVFRRSAAASIMNWVWPLRDVARLDLRDAHSLRLSALRIVSTTAWDDRDCSSTLPRARLTCTTRIDEVAARRDHRPVQLLWRRAWRDGCDRSQSITIAQLLEQLGEHEAARTMIWRMLPKLRKSAARDGDPSEMIAAQIELSLRPCDGS